MPSSENIGNEAAARRALARETRAYPRFVAELRESLFSRHVDLNVRTATPLLGIVARDTGLDLDAAVTSIRPPRSWPAVPMATDARRSSSGIERDFAFTPSQIAHRHRYAGKIAHADRHGDDVVGVRILSTSVELTVVRGTLRIDTYHGFARIMIDGSVPETIAMAMTGQPVTRLLDHPWLEGSWKVVFVTRRPSGLTAVVFDTGQVPWRLRPSVRILDVRELIAC